MKEENKNRNFNSMILYFKRNRMIDRFIIKNINIFFLEIAIYFGIGIFVKVNMVTNSNYYWIEFDFKICRSFIIILFVRNNAGHTFKLGVLMSQTVVSGS